MRFVTLSAAMASILALGLSPAHGQTPRPDQSDRETAKDVATQPAQDLNLKKNEIPKELLEIEENPYSLDGMRRCSDIRRAVRRLDRVLGDDLDTVEDAKKSDKRRRTAGSIGKSIIGGIIPFRGLVREVTGAAGAERRYNQALYAGVVRRSFLKGIGQQRGCKPPAAPIPFKKQATVKK